MFKSTNEIVFRGDVAIQTLIGKDSREGEVAIVLAALTDSGEPGRKVSKDMEILEAAVQTKLTFTSEASIEVLIKKLQQAHKVLAMQRVAKEEAKAKFEQDKKEEEAKRIANNTALKNDPDNSRDNFNKLVQLTALAGKNVKHPIKDPIQYCFHNVFKSKKTGLDVVSTKCFNIFDEAVDDGIKFPNYVKTITRINYVGDVEIIDSNSDLAGFFAEED